MGTAVPRTQRASQTRPLTHEERVALVNKPFPVVINRYPGKTWAGALISREELPIEGRRRYSPSPEDEEMGSNLTVLIEELL